MSSIVLDERQERLELGGISGPIEAAGRAGGPNAGLKALIRRKPGVLIFEDIPAGLVVHARVVWAHDLQGEDVGSRGVGTVAAGIPLAYRFEHAVPPDLTLPGGAVVARTVKRFIIPSPAAVGGPVTYAHNVPAFAVFAPVQDGILFQRGKLEHTIPMPGNAAGQRQEHLRLRWVGTAVVAATLLTAAGETAMEDTTWASGHLDLVPGSIEITLPTSGAVLRDDGFGRLLTSGTGPSEADGVVDYQTGAFTLKAAAAETGVVLVDYEHGCPYHPLDAYLAWDARIQ